MFQAIKTFSTEFSKVTYNTNWGTQTKYANAEVYVLDMITTVIQK